MTPAVFLQADSPASDPPEYSRSRNKQACNGKKMKAIDGKMRMTDVADTEQLFRLIQSIPSPEAEPFNVKS